MVYQQQEMKKYVTVQILTYEIEKGNENVSNSIQP